jgi:serine/threonine-protein kinase
VPPDSVPGLLDEIRRSGLLDERDLQKVTVDLPPGAAPNPHEVAVSLVRKNVLTAFQAEELLAGRAERCLVAGRYRLLEKLGEGGMGAVYRARDLTLDREVALKVLPGHSAYAADAVARFQREARALARVSHPNVVHAHDAGEDRGRPFLVMEYIDGVNLAQLLRDNGRVAPALAADYARQAALGLQHAHERGLVHRDLKPGNLLLTPERQVKILDLGLARFLSDQVGEPGLTRDGSGMGTPDYMAPEQFQNAREADARSDVYSLGCTLFHLLSGRVPFPGSSLDEKARAHAEQGPPGPAELSPDVPAGLAVVAQKMMAKRPADRFQTAGEAAEALLPFVSGLSASLPDIRHTVSWQSGRLVMSTATRSGRRRRALAALAIFALLAMAAGAWLFLSGDGSDGSAPAGTAGGGENSPPKSKMVTFPDGLTVAKDGTGQYRTIQEALDRVRPGQTVRVLDDATYPEALSLTQAERHQGITLEAVKGATLAPRGSALVINVQNVPGFTLRGFRLRGQAVGGVVVFGRSAGALLEGLDVRLDRSTSRAGVSIERIPPAAVSPPVIVRGCTFTGLGGNAVRVSGFAEYTVPDPSARVLVRDNQVIDCAGGIWLGGSLRQVQVVGNRIRGVAEFGLQVQNLMAGTEDILIANNTLVRCGAALRFFDTGEKGKGVRFCNNLVLGAEKPDLVYVRGNPNFTDPQGAGDGPALLRAWQFDHNWREARQPRGESMFEKGWIPPSEADHLQTSLPGLSRAKGADWPRPLKGSDLALKGAGGDLPAYVGALPPAGAEPWDWQWTWDALADRLLTVSKDPKSGGRFRSLGAALGHVKAGMTVRVLDDATYRETLVLNLPRHSGVTLEARQRATLEADVERGNLLEIVVPGVTVRGFRLRALAGRMTLVALHGDPHGTTLEHLGFDTKVKEGRTSGVEIREVSPDLEKPPVLIRESTFRGLALAVGILGDGDGAAYATPAACGRIRIQGNTVTNCVCGVVARGEVLHVHVTGNRFLGSHTFAVQVENLLGRADDLLIANNTFLENQVAIRCWDSAPKAKGVEIRNNLILGSRGLDLLFLDSGGQPNEHQGPGDGQALARAWRWGQNWREGKEPGASALRKGWIPPTAADVLQEEIPGLAREPSEAERFLRPAKGSDLALKGAGGDLPSYVGAVRPEGVPAAWNWDQTWKARLTNAKGKGNPPG